ncbi:MAG: DUF3800 domain-containing protein [Erysipelotrichaceae bacterium]|nr:DUF3800 domain-containing protein [Erysipelotrichaceae bacterium]
MILYVDETESDEFFIVAGLLTNSKKDTDMTYKHFKKKIRNMPLSAHEKEKVFTEFKSVLLDNQYQRIKICMLEHINSLNYTIIYSVFYKSDRKIFQMQKEEQYICLLSKIIMHIDCDIDVIFDTFNKKDFENKIIESAKEFDNIKSIKKQDSRLEYGLQFIDNICSVIRAYKTYDNSNYYYMLSNFVEVK